MCRKLICLCFFPLLWCATADTVVAGPLVAHWKMDDGSGTVARDSSGNNFHGNLMGTTKWVAGKTAAFTQAIGLLVNPQDPKMDLSPDGQINFKDYAVLIDSWLEEKLWP